MPRKPNYQFEKRQKELDRQARKAEKLQRRHERNVEADAPATPAADVDQPTNGRPTTDSLQGGA